MKEYLLVYYPYKSGLLEIDQNDRLCLLKSPATVWEFYRTWG